MLVNGLTNKRVLIEFNNLILFFSVSEKFMQHILNYIDKLLFIHLLILTAKKALLNAFFATKTKEFFGMPCSFDAKSDDYATFSTSFDCMRRTVLIHSAKAFHVIW